ncbi:MAG: hypothetical protein WAS73_06155 [Defluviicoccus sp.]
MVNVPAEAMSLGQFVRDEAGGELSAIQHAFECLAAARQTAAVVEAGDAFAAAVARFHKRARLRLLGGEIIAYGVPPADPWAAPVEIEGRLWEGLVWGAEEEGGLAGRLTKAQGWKPRPADAFSIAFTEAWGGVELPGGADLTAEIAFEWMKSVCLNEVCFGLCPQGAWDRKHRTGWRVLGLAYMPRPGRMRCRVIPAAAIRPEAACRAWLAAAVAAGDPKQTKPCFWADAQVKFGVSKRAFEGIWAEVTRGHPAWTQPGRRGARK